MNLSTTHPQAKRAGFTKEEARNGSDRLQSPLWTGPFRTVSQRASQRAPLLDQNASGADGPHLKRF